MEQNIQNSPTKEQLATGWAAFAGDVEAAAGYENKKKVTDEAALGAAATDGEVYPSKDWAATEGPITEPGHVATQVAEEVRDNWTGYQEGSFKEMHGTDPVSAARVAVTAAESQGPPLPPIPGAGA